MMPEMAGEAARAARVACPYCGADIGEPCVNKRTGLPFKWFPAHDVRVRNSRGDAL